MDKEVVIYYLCSLGQLLDRKSVEILKRPDVICISSFRENPPWIRATIRPRPKSVFEIIKFVLYQHTLVRKYRSHPRLKVYAPHVFNYGPNLFANNTDAEIVIVGEGTIDHYTAPPTRKELFFSFFMWGLAACLGERYKVNSKDIRDGREQAWERELPVFEDYEGGNNVLILGPLFGDRKGYDLNFMIERFEEACEKIQGDKVYFKPHPKEIFMDWPGKMGIKTISDSAPAELLVEKYGIGHVVAIFSSVLTNVTMMYPEQVKAYSVSLDQLLEKGFLNEAGVSSLIETYQEHGVELFWAPKP